MKRKVIPWVIMTVLPVAGWAVAKEMTGRAWLQQVPDLPDKAQAAYAQWQDDEGNLKPGFAFQTVETGLTNVASDQTLAAMATPELQQQMAMAQQMQQQFGSPDGQAKLQSMSPAELMAMASADATAANQHAGVGARSGIGQANGCLSADGRG